MKGSYRSVEEWKSALMLLPDGNFFDLLRSVLGNIKTPFSKQRLLDDLFKLLSNSEIKETIGAYINEQDKRVIAAIALLDEPTLTDLETFFSGEISFAELHALLINLEERLILYRFRAPSSGNKITGRSSSQDDTILRLALNPVLEPVLTPFIEEPNVLFPSFMAEQCSAIEQNSVSESGIPVVQSPEGSSETVVCACINNNKTMAALFALLLGEEGILRIELEIESRGTSFPGLRKKILAKGKKIFPGLDLELTVCTFLTLGLFHIEGQGLWPNWEKIEDFKTLSLKERYICWAAGVYLCLNKDDQAGYSGSFSRARLHRAASLMHRFMSHIDPKRLYPEITLKRLLEFSESLRKNLKSLWEAPPFSGQTEFPFESFLAVMNKTGLLEKSGSYWKAGEGFSKAPPRSKEEKDRKPVIVMDAAFSFILYPEISFPDALFLGSFCSVKQSDDASERFELSRQSVVRGFDMGINSDAMMALLDRLSGSRLDANLGWTLKEWENRYTGVSLSQGIVLTLAEEYRYLADAGPVSQLIQRTLANGVYLLSSDERSDAAAVLRKAGVEIFAQPPAAAIYQTGKGKSSGALYRSSSHSFLQDSFPRFTEDPSFLEYGDSAVCKGNAEAIQEKFRRALDKMKLTKQERDELLARIDRRLILSEVQLEARSLRYEKLEARGLDYSGKSSIAKQAVENGSLLEVTWSVSGSGQSHTLGIPQALEKKEGESILVLKTSKSGDTIRIPIGKISLLRRIKQSIFGE